MLVMRLCRLHFCYPRGYCEELFILRVLINGSQVYTCSMLFYIYQFELCGVQEIFFISLVQDALASDVLSSIVTRQVMQCPICAAPFEILQSLKNHVNAVHLRKKCFRCDACGEGFMWSKTLWRHQKTPGKCPCAGAVPFQFP